MSANSAILIAILFSNPCITISLEQKHAEQVLEGCVNNFEWSLRIECGRNIWVIESVEIRDRKLTFAELNCLERLSSIKRINVTQVSDVEVFENFPRCKELAKVFIDHRLKKMTIYTSGPRQFSKILAYLREDNFVVLVPNEEELGQILVPQSDAMPYYDILINFCSANGLSMGITTKGISLKANIEFPPPSLNLR